METKEVCERYITPCFVEGLDAYEGITDFEYEKNLISNDFAIKLGLQYEVMKNGVKVVNCGLLVAIKGELYFVGFVINPEEDDFEPVSLDLFRLATTLNRLERSIKSGIYKWYQSLSDDENPPPPPPQQTPTQQAPYTVSTIKLPILKKGDRRDRILFIIISGCFKAHDGNLKLLRNITIKRVYTLQGLNHNLFFVGQFCYVDLEVAFRKSTCYVRDLKGNDLLTGSCGSDLYSITLQDTTSPNPICLMAKATSSQAWLWHHRLSHLNFDSINLLSKNDIVIGLPKLKFVKDHLFSSCELGKSKESIKGKKYVLVIVDDYSRYTWTHFLRSKDETPKVLIDFLILVQRGLHAQVRTVQTDRGIEFLNKTLHAYFAKEGIEHETSSVRTPEQNGVVERQNRTLVEAARTMLSVAKVPLFLLGEAIAIDILLKNHTLVIPLKDGENLDNDGKRWMHVFFVGYFSTTVKMVIEGLEVSSIRRIQGIGYGVLEFLGVGTTHGYAVSSLMDTAYWLSE
ncbi:retrovirus-related pol polyprotein from transposon TNT 1-94 [Tanacetum coccineum]